MKNDFFVGDSGSVDSFALNEDGAATRASEPPLSLKRRLREDGRKA